MEAQARDDFKSIVSFVRECHPYRRWSVAQRLGPGLGRASSLRLRATGGGTWHMQAAAREAREREQDSVHDDRGPGPGPNRTPCC